MLQSDLTVALKHVATHFAQWTRQLARAVAYHKRHPQTQEARRRSGLARGQHGLTHEEWQLREDKRTATRDYYLAIDLNAEDLAARGHTICRPAAASEGKAKGKKRDHKGRGAAEHSHWPRRYEDMRSAEHQLVYYYRSGWLRTRMHTTRALCHPVQAPRFIFESEQIS